MAPAQILTKYIKASTVMAKKNKDEVKGISNHSIPAGVISNKGAQSEISKSSESTPAVQKNFKFKFANISFP